MSDKSIIRRSRTVENFSRGFELIRAIREMQKLNAEADWRLIDGEWFPPSTLINPRIQAIVAEFDLTLAEWHYWCRHSIGLGA